MSSPQDHFDIELVDGPLEGTRMRVASEYAAPPPLLSVGEYVYARPGSQDATGTQPWRYTFVSRR